tara:strand:- start:95319 stop:98225 length:2907 start_codon:yes stop_codon:yes gene_type:complete
MLPSDLQDHWQNLQRTLTDHASRHEFGWTEFWDSLATEQQNAVQRVLCLSDYVTDALPRDADYFSVQMRTNRMERITGRDDYHRWLDEFSASAESEDDWHKALRQLRRRAMVHIIWRDALRVGNTLETTRSLSELADVCVCRSIDFLLPDLRRRFGDPIGKQSGRVQNLLVLGMGKLGGYELNLSSDVDMIFAFPESGDTDGEKSISNQEFFTRLGQKLILALDKKTVDGFVFRVDMRLRPYGQSGPLVMNFASLSEYYHTQGRDWERYAMIKARVMTGEDSAEARRLLNILRAFTYRRYLDYSAFESMRGMKAMIRDEVRRRGLEDHIKLGAGGIREVEFTVQVFQLIRGGQNTQLQSRELIKVLAMLAEDGYLETESAAGLREAYYFLRDSEHAIQALRDEQTQILPDTPVDQARVAWSLNCVDWTEYRERLQQHRDVVSHHFAELIEAEDDEQTDNAEQVWEDIWNGEAEGHVLAQHPGESGDEVVALLNQFRESRPVQNMQEIGRDRLETLMPLLVRELWDQPNPLETLQRLLPLLDAVLRRTTYMVLLIENPQALRQLLRLCSASGWVAEYITETPVLLDELLDPKGLYDVPGHDKLSEELNLRLLRIEPEDLELQMEQLRQFVRAHKLHAAAREVMATQPLMRISDYLTMLAEVILKKVSELAFEQMVIKYGYPTDEAGDPVTQPEFVVIGYGKFGGIELSYSSDLDLVFLHNAHAKGSTSGGPRSLENNVFYTRMGQRMVHLLQTQTHSGFLYEVDLRLRPSGSSGMAVSSLRSFEEYQQSNAWTWEHQALVRARVICGDETIGQAWSEIRAGILAQQRDPQTLRNEVRDMRQKMREQLGSRDPKKQEFHLKQDAGGIVDIEFLVQYGVLAWSHQYPALLEFTDNMRILDAFATAGLMDPQDCQTLQDTYLSYRAETHRRALQKRSLLLSLDETSRLGFDARRKNVTRLWQLWLEPDAQGH